MSVSYNMICITLISNLPHLLYMLGSVRGPTLSLDRVPVEPYTLLPMSTTGATTTTGVVEAVTAPLGFQSSESVLQLFEQAHIKALIDLELLTDPTTSTTQTQAQHTHLNKDKDTTTAETYTTTSTASTTASRSQNTLKSRSYSRTRRAAASTTTTDTTTTTTTGKASRASERTRSASNGNSNKRDSSFHSTTTGSGNKVHSTNIQPTFISMLYLYFIDYFKWIVALLCLPVYYYVNQVQKKKASLIFSHHTTSNDETETQKSYQFFGYNYPSSVDHSSVYQYVVTTCLLGVLYVHRIIVEDALPLFFSHTTTCGTYHHTSAAAAATPLSLHQVKKRPSADLHDLINTSSTTAYTPSSATNTTSTTTLTSTTVTAKDVTSESSSSESPLAQLLQMLEKEDRCNNKLLKKKLTASHNSAAAKKRQGVCVTKQPSSSSTTATAVAKDQSKCPSSSDNDNAGDGVHTDALYGSMSPAAQPSHDKLMDALLYEDAYWSEVELNGHNSDGWIESGTKKIKSSRSVDAHDHAISGANATNTTSDEMKRQKSIAEYRQREQLERRRLQELSDKQKQLAYAARQQASRLAPKKKAPVKATTSPIAASSSRACEDLAEEGGHSAEVMPTGPMKQSSTEVNSRDITPSVAAPIQYQPRPSRYSANRNPTLLTISTTAAHEGRLNTRRMSSRKASISCTDGEDTSHDDSDSLSTVTGESGTLRKMTPNLQQQGDDAVYHTNNTYDQQRIHIAPMSIQLQPLPVEGYHMNILQQMSHSQAMMMMPQPQHSPYPPAHYHFDQMQQPHPHQQHLYQQQMQQQQHYQYMHMNNANDMLPMYDKNMPHVMHYHPSQYSPHPHSPLTPFPGHSPTHMNIPQPQHSPMSTPHNYDRPTYPPIDLNSEEYVKQVEAIRLQIEYYFSTENLARDTYLRSNMDDRGMVLFSEIIQFRRIQNLHATGFLLVQAILRSHQLRFLESNTVSAARDHSIPLYSLPEHELLMCKVGSVYEASLN